MFCRQYIAGQRGICTYYYFRPIPSSFIVSCIFSSSLRGPRSRRSSNPCQSCGLRGITTMTPTDTDPATFLRPKPIIAGAGSGVRWSNGDVRSRGRPSDREYFVGGGGGGGGGVKHKIGMPRAVCSQTVFDTRGAVNHILVSTDIGLYYIYDSQRYSDTAGTRMLIVGPRHTNVSVVYTVYPVRHRRRSRPSKKPTKKRPRIKNKIKRKKAGQ